jgi:aspartate racemase
MPKGRCLGLVGGLGVGAAIHYYERLAEAHEKQGVSLDLVMVHAEASRVFTYVQAGDRAGLADYLAGFLHRLQAAGAELAVIPAVTPHFCLQELVATSPLPLFNIFDPLRQELLARSIKRVAVWGTRFVMESELFGMLPGVEIVRGRPEEVEHIHNTYVELVRRGKGSEEQFQSLTRLAQTFCQRDRAEAIVFAGTDLTVLFHEANTNFPYIDCAALHLRAILNSLLRERSSP